jgi:4-aminobutyrate aminotransferase
MSAIAMPPRVPHIRVKPPGPKARAVIAKDKRFLATATKDAPLVVKRAQGSVIEDVDGNRFIDFTCGVSVLNVGFGHPRVVEAIQEQATRYTHFAGTDYYYEEQNRLAERLAKAAPGRRPRKVFFANSGAESNEAAIKLARHRRGQGVFLAFLGAFHGRTMGALSLTASKPVQRRGHPPTMPSAVHVPYAYCYRCPYKLTYPSCDLYCADIIEERYLSTVAPPEDVAALFVEPVQGEGGYIVPPAGWLDRIQEICRDHDFLMVSDEVQAGMGRTGKLFAVQHSKAQPDLMTSAKSLGGGLPLGAAILDADLDFREPGVHSTTFGGNAAACAAANATLDVIEEEDLLANATRLGIQMEKRLDEMQTERPCMGDNRGVGLMRATEFVKDPMTREPDPELRDRITTQAFRRGLVLLGAGRSAIRYIPALNIPEDLLGKGLDILEESIDAAL